MSAKAAALYLRSSKDRKDVSIENQRQELLELAAARGLHVVAEFSDVVESGKDEDRPGFIRLLKAIRLRSRGWVTLLLLDTARLARRDYISVMFEEEARKYGVRVLYKAVPDANPITEMVVKGIFRTMDQWHSMISREKGLSGMKENVRTGFRAGGRAPTGYRLERHDIGVVREGLPVQKSKLVADPVLAPKVAAYLQARAGGAKRAFAATSAGLDMAKASLVGLEHNALTYAGCTVWNVHNEIQPGGGYPNGQKRRPRSEWVINEGTHPPLITMTQAEVLLANLEAFDKRQPRKSAGKYLLSGLLRTPEGEPWWGERGCYRAQVNGPKRYFPQEEVEEAVVHQVMADLLSPAFVRQLTRQAHADAAEIEGDPAEGLRAQVTELTARIGRMLDLAAEMETAAPALRRIEDMERQREAMRADIEVLEKESQRKALLSQTSEHKVRRLLVEISEDLGEKDREAMKEAMVRTIASIVLDPGTLRMHINYRVRLASPRGFDSKPAELRASTEVALRRAR